MPSSGFARDDRAFATATPGRVLEGGEALKAATLWRRDVTLGPGPALKVSAPIGGAALDIADQHNEPATVPAPLTVNGKRYELEVEPWATLLDLLREHLHLTGIRKGCGRGQCGACTMLADDVRMSACLAPAAVYDGCVSGFTA